MRPRRYEKQSSGSRAVDTYGGKVQLRWDADAAVTAYGQMPYFIEFLKTAGLFDDWVSTRPLRRDSAWQSREARYRSRTCPARRGTIRVHPADGTRPNETT